MSRSVLVVGSGASGVHFAQTALEKGLHVTMVDVGGEESAAPLPSATFDQLKEQLDDPVDYFLGAGFEGVVLPDDAGEYYGFPPGKQVAVERWREHDGFEPLRSFARGGLAQVWTAGCYPFNDHDLVDFPFRYEALKSSYDEVARRIGVTGEVDDLARFLPVHEHLLPPLRLDAASRSLLDAYAVKKSLLNTRHRVFVGRTRVATLSQQDGDREPCGHLGRCLWGCPREALYTPSITLALLQRHPSFRYVPGRIAERLTLGEGGQASSLVCRRIADNAEEQLPVERVVLAAGTLGSATIMLRTLQAATGGAVRLHGLMDNRQVLVPFVQLRRLGQRRELAEYQYHLVGMALLGEDPKDFVHCQVTTLKSALLHPILQRLPFDLRTSAAIGRLTTAALGVVNVNFADTRRADCEAWLENDRLKLRYVSPPDESRRIERSLATVRRALRAMGCFVPPGLQHIRPMGASAHYTGLFPMTTSQTKYATTSNGQSWDVPNVYFADGSTFPTLPAKNLTFTLMANATRIAREAF